MTEISDVDFAPAPSIWIGSVEIPMKWANCPAYGGALPDWLVQSRMPRTSDGKLKVEGRTPDKADALAMAFSAPKPLKPKVGQVWRRLVPMRRSRNIGWVERTIGAVGPLYIRLSDHRGLDEWAAVTNFHEIWEFVSEPCKAKPPEPKVGQVWRRKEKNIGRHHFYNHGREQTITEIRGNKVYFSCGWNSRLDRLHTFWEFVSEPEPSLYHWLGGAADA